MILGKYPSLQVGFEKRKDIGVRTPFNRGFGSQCSDLQCRTHPGVSFGGAVVCGRKHLPSTAPALRPAKPSVSIEGAGSLSPEGDHCSRAEDVPVSIASGADLLEPWTSGGDPPSITGQAATPYTATWLFSGTPNLTTAISTGCPSRTMWMRRIDRKQLVRKLLGTYLNTQNKP
jgi:hypothetical protein